MPYSKVEFSDGKGYTRFGSPAFYKLLEEMADLHSRKSHDYANDNNPSGNYHFAGRMALMFSHSPEDAGFFGRLAEKIYRLSNLESSGKSPKNEAVEDTENDIAVITCLWMADRKERRRKDNANRTISGMELETNSRMINQIDVQIPAPIPGEKYDEYAVRLVGVIKAQIAAAL